LYAWGDRVFQESIATGYIESADGWKLKLPKFDIYIDLERSVKQINRLEWQMYSAGKKEWKLFKEPLKKGEVPYVIKVQANVDVYNKHKMNVSGFFKLKSEYQRLCLNNPVQSRSAHQLKLATCLVFEAIEKQNLINIVKICNTIHDEIVLDSPNEHAGWAKTMLEDSMLEGGNHYLTNLKIKADANIGPSWGEAK
jgi:DNA polymerase I-like protein with 3'-5' exonuclease and polymerase domains